MDTHYGGFARRAIAYLIDNFAINALASIFFIGSTALTMEDDLDFASLLVSLVFYQVAFVIISLFYFTFFHAARGQTIGKWIMRLKVVTVSGEPLTAGVAFLRWVGYFISTVVFFLGFIWIIFDWRKQGWHDKIAGTCVVEVREEAQAEAVAEQPDLFAKMP
jgi:uncharacterized RDD family membrane protein YckC